MRIDDLRIVNFKGFADRTFQFHPHFNLLVGDNASGKSTVLDALAVAVGSWFLGIRGVSKSPGIDKRYVRTAAHRQMDGFTFEKQFPSRIECTGLVGAQQARWSRELRNEASRTNSIEAKAIIDAALQTERDVRDGRPVTLPLICSYGTERLWFEKGHRNGREAKNDARRGPSRFDGYRDCFEFTIQETELIDWVRDQSTVALPARTDTIALTLVKEAIRNCVEGAKGLYYDGRYKDLVVEMHDGPQLFKNLSDGQIIMLTLVGDLAKRAAILNPHLGVSALRDTPGVVAIDELDLHLHPKWQRRVIGDLKSTFPALQFITTSHSPQLIGEARPEEIIRLDSEGASHPPRSFGIDSSRILEEVMGASPRNPGVEGKLSRLSRLIDQEDFNGAQDALVEVEAELGPDDPEIMRARTLMSFLESTT